MIVEIVWFYGDNNDNMLEDDQAVLFATIDGTHCRIFEPQKDPGPKWFSYKFHGPALGYEIVIDVWSQRVVHIHGPYHARDNDIKNFRKPEGIMDQIPPGRKLIGDTGYQGEPDKITTPNPHDSLIVKQFKNRARARHETFNKRIKDYQILRQEFRSDTSYHQIVFESICILCQYDIENGHPLFQT
jgi:DDE superfamily endonuclease